MLQEAKLEQKPAGKDIIIVNNVSKKFRLPIDKKRTVFENVIGLLNGDKFQYNELWALKDVSFTIREGETFGVIGSNGSGKSTLLKIIAGVLYPDMGSVKVNGKIAPFLELGVGFQPELTALENVYIYGSIMGMSRKMIDRNIDNIFEFAELARFKNVRLKNFSSGMYARLAFSTAISTDPDILLIDEALSVGDEAFQAKCFDKINEIKAKGKTIVFVTHGMGTVSQICDRVILLDHGKVLSMGSSQRVIDQYRINMRSDENAAMKKQHEKVQHKTETQSHSTATNEPAKEIDRWGTREIEIICVDFFNEGGIQKFIFNTGDMMRIVIRYIAKSKVKSPVFGIAIYRNDGTHVNGTNQKLHNQIICEAAEEGAVECIIKELPLLSGSYQLTAAVYDFNCIRPFDHHERKYPFKVISVNDKNVGLIPVSCTWKGTDRTCNTAEVEANVKKDNKDIS